ncbi:MAG: hypothetical protein N2485_04790 [bacterium]|nr:hypothetical protein [bacterium]
MYKFIDSYLKSVFYEREKQIISLVKDFIIPDKLKDKAKIELIEIIPVKEEYYIKAIPDYISKIRINEEEYYVNIEFQSSIKRDIIFKTSLYNLLLSKELDKEVISLILLLDKKEGKEKSIYYQESSKRIRIGNEIVKTNIYKVLVINLLNDKVKEKIRSKDYMGLIELIESYERGYKKEVLNEIIREIEGKINKGEYKEEEGKRLKIIIGMLYIEKGAISYKEVNQMLDIDKEDYIKLYKRNPMLKDIVDTVYGKQMKEMEKILKEKEKQLEKEKKEVLKEKEQILKEKEEILKEKEKEIIKVLVITKLPKEKQKILIEIQKIEEIEKLLKIKEIMLLDLEPDEYIQAIKEIIQK